MEISEFAEQTTVYAKDQPEYLPLPAHRFRDDSSGRIACCWKLSLRERLRLLWSGVLWHEILTFGKPLQPQRLSVDKPLMPSPEDHAAGSLIRRMEMDGVTLDRKTANSLVEMAALPLGLAEEEA